MPDWNHFLRQRSQDSAPPEAIEELARQFVDRDRERRGAPAAAPPVALGEG